MIKNDFYLSPNERKALTPQPQVCNFCGTNLPVTDIQAYEHDGGWQVPGYDYKMWLYVTCSKCKYQHSLEKLGIKR